ncbi:MAG: hypothetical protein ACYSWU_24705 [Planctomycetota bacterium]|jgi:hypothetical protein
MAITQAPPPNMVTKGAISANFFRLFGDVWLFGAATTPTDGTSGDGAGWAGIGSIYIDSDAGEIYTNTNTKASPTWTNQT